MRTNVHDDECESSVEHGSVLGQDVDGGKSWMDHHDEEVHLGGVGGGDGGGEHDEEAGEGGEGAGRQDHGGQEVQGKRTQGEDRVAATYLEMK